MTLSSTATEAEVWAEYDDTASYEEQGSRALALRFVTACRILLRRRPVSAGRRDMTMQFESIADEMQRARQWLAANPAAGGSGGGGRTRFADFTNFRD
jgi:hypothetical protein